MGMPAARVGDWHECPGVDPGPIPHVGGPILPPCEPTVIVAGKPAARVGDHAKCVPSVDTIAVGDYSIYIGGKPASVSSRDWAGMGNICRRIAENPALASTAVSSCRWPDVRRIYVDQSGSPDSTNAAQ
jgi:uncharacterized Zn-binding protein involved in type VI secretion